MFVTIPNHKQIRMMGNGTAVQAWDEGEADAPTMPDGAPLPSSEFQFVRDFMRRMLLNDNSWGGSMEKLYIAMDLRTAFAKAKPGDVVEMTKAQYDALLGVMKAPAVPYNTAVAILLVDFFRAIEEASSKKPEGVETTT